MCDIGVHRPTEFQLLEHKRNTLYFVNIFSEHIYGTTFFLPTVFQSCRAMDQLLHILKCLLQVRKSLKHDNIHKLCLCLK